MHLRRMRPVAALTLALLAAPFLAATAVAAQSGGPPDAGTTPEAVTVSWLSKSTASIQRVVDAISVAVAEHAIPPSPIEPAPPLRAVAPPPPPPPPPPSVDDLATWRWPANGPITSGFGHRWGRAHEGVDIDAAFGSDVIAAHRGTVIQAGWGMSGYGLVVHIDHGNGLVTTYNHLNTVDAVVGSFVEQGTKIGTVGATGSVTAAHLHYEVRDRGVPRNPTAWLPAGGASAAGNPG